MKIEAEIKAAAMNKGVTWAQVKGFNEAGELEAIASNGRLDRSGESIDPGAWEQDLPDFLANPVILATHQQRLDNGHSPVIGSVKSIQAGKGGLVFVMKFAGTDLGRQYEQLYREGHMRAFSVGFIPVSGRMEDLPDAGGKGRVKVWVHTRCKLLEISCVPVPANPDALAKALAAEHAGEFADSVAAAVIAKFTVAGAPIAPQAWAELENIVEGFAREVRSHVDERIDELIVNLGYRGLAGTDSYPEESGDGDDADRGHRRGEDQGVKDTPAQTAAKRLLGEQAKD